MLGPMNRAAMRDLQRKIERFAEQGLDWTTFSSRTASLVRDAVRFDRACWHPVDPGTHLFTGSLSHNMVCMATWLAHHEYAVDDFNKWHDLAFGEKHAASLLVATNGDIGKSARARSSAEYGRPVADELRVSFVSNGTYWGAAGLLRASGAPFTEEDVDLLEFLAPTIGDGLRRAMLATASEEQPQDEETTSGVLVLDEKGALLSTSPAAEKLVDRLMETPRPSSPHEARAVQAVAARSRSGGSAFARARTADGMWLQLYATSLAGERAGHVAVVIQPAAPQDVAPIVARAYGLSTAERRIARFCLEGRSTKAIAEALDITEYTVQDHLKAIFRKTGASTRGELVARVFLEHYVPRFESLDETSDGWSGEAIRTSPRSAV
jgi:DNA-binding CsgD family transcriptional regulator